MNKEIKLDLYVRTNDNEILTLDKYYINKNMMTDEHYLTIEYLLEFEPITKIANDPRELIEVGDLIQFKTVLNFATRVIDKKFFINILKEKPKTITKILTPNSNGGYDEQWSDNK